MRILFLTGNLKYRASYVSLFYPIHRELLKTGIVDIKEVNTLHNKKIRYKEHIVKCKKRPKNIIKHLDVEYVNDNYDIVFLENPYPFWFEEWHKIKAKKILALGDLHNLRNTNIIKRAKNRIGISTIFVKYIDYFNKNFDNEGLSIYHWPHSADIEIFKDYGLNKNYDILLTGMISNNIYLIRNKIYNKLRNEKYFKRIERPNNKIDKFPNPWPVGKEYAKELNKSKISIACTSKFKYTVAKIFEIPACRTSLLCDYSKEMKSLGFVPDENFIEIDKKNIKKQIEYLLFSKDSKLKEVTNNGYDFIRENHTTTNRVNDFLKYCGKIYNWREI